MDYLLYLLIFGLSFFIASFVSDEHSPKIALFKKAFLIEFIVIFAFGLIFREFNLGYFFGKEKTAEDFFTISIFSIFMSSIIGLKAAYPDIN